MITRFRQRLRLRICPFERLLSAIPRDSRVLDVGCGEGLLVELLIATGHASVAVGFDSNLRAIRRARQRAKKNGFSARAMYEHSGVDSAWPTALGPFDVVTIIDVMHHLPPTVHPRVWTQAAHSLRPGGLLVYKDIAGSPIWMALANRLHDLVFNFDRIHYVSLDSVTQKAYEVGLVELERADIRRLWYQHEMLILTRQ